MKATKWPTGVNRKGFLRVKSKEARNVEEVYESIASTLLVLPFYLTALFSLNRILVGAYKKDRSAYDPFGTHPLAVTLCEEIYIYSQLVSFM